MAKKFLSSYFSFTKKERGGVIGLIILITFFLALPFLFPFFIKQKIYSHTQFEKEIDSLQTSKQDSSYAKKDFKKENEEENSYHDYKETSSYKKYDSDKYSDTIKGELFYFDPNTLDADGWKRLGVRDRTVQTIQKYLSKGGKFRSSEDIGRIWGLPNELVQRIMPYAKIAHIDTPAYKQYAPLTYTKTEYKKDIGPIDVNTADTNAFISLPGIGNRLANRIVNFRNKLGGFYKIDQVGETFLLPDSVFQLIKPRLILANPTVKQININTATIEQLKDHPYIRYYVGNSIIQYRTQHGKFSSIDDIKKVPLVTEDIFNKASPYLNAID